MYFNNREFKSQYIKFAKIYEYLLFKKVKKYYYSITKKRNFIKNDKIKYKIYMCSLYGCNKFKVIVMEIKIVVIWLFFQIFIICSFQIIYKNKIEFTLKVNGNIR